MRPVQRQSNQYRQGGQQQKRRAIRGAKKINNKREHASAVNSAHSWKASHRPSQERALCSSAGQTAGRLQ